MDEMKTQILPARREGHAVLLGFSPYGHTEDFTLTGKHSFGRKTGIDNEEDITVLSPAISRKHGEFGVIEGFGFYRDLGSKNGTYINGKECTGVQNLEDGDILSVRFRSGNSEEPAYFMIYTITPGEYQWEKLDLNSGINEILVGRKGGNLKLRDAVMSRNHGIFLKSDEGWSITDLNSRNGIYVNQNRIEGRTRLKKFDVVRIGYTWFVYLEDQMWIGTEFQESVKMMEEPGRQELKYQEPVRESYDEPKYQDDAYQKPVREAETSGYQNSVNEYETPNYQKSVSEYDEPSYQESTYEPTESAYQEPTYEPAYQEPRYQTTVNEYNDEPMYEPATEKVYSGETLSIHIRERNVWKNFKKKTLLRDIDLEIAPGEFVLILGGSGAGKSTFMKSVIGYEKAEGSITFGDVDIYDDYDVMKYEIGYVPQKDLIRNNDSVYNTVLSAAKMKMEHGLSEVEYLEQTDWVIELLGLTPDRDTLAGRLSGGQKKRLSIAVELVGDPNLFFLDEPDSGLDGIMARSLMENLKKISDMGKIVMVITHGPDRAADLFTKVLVLAKSQEDQTGHLAFFGGVKEAKDYFEVDNLEDIVRRINRKDEGGEGLADEFIRRAESNRYREAD
ncbi:MAG: ATP-binding cassette domain-containing protein [Eubacteriales bacterium]|nr:ATP-binding cassette domain-containing protein [Eubacteriales bacterium]